ncbi:DNA ligase 1-like [Impatiens glandulifera]|uniref:DNA ligase 1-like n=1 Tax=Impatiens glandulifera TaxID=253017 RepID=UPI001FB0E0AC|nr:DNA ligase 1-like [Impatiens glandulifera]
MVEDVDAFLRVPWGKVFFRATLKGVKNDMKHHRVVYLSKKKQAQENKWATENTDFFSYNVNGFAFQCGPMRSSKVEEIRSEIVDAVEGKVVTKMEESEVEKSLYNGVDFEQTDNCFYDLFEGFINGGKRKPKDEDVNITPKPAPKLRKSKVEDDEKKEKQLHENEMKNEKKELHEEEKKDDKEERKKEMKEEHEHEHEVENEEEKNDKKLENEKDNKKLKLLYGSRHEQKEMKEEHEHEDKDDKEDFGSNYFD